MHIQFSPTLDETIHISNSPEHAPIILIFTATLSLDDYYALTQVGAKIQLWSNIRPGVEWSEFDFLDPNPFDVTDSEVDLGVISLCQPTFHHSRGFLDRPRKHTLSLNLPIPQARDDQPQHYFFTYRLLSPSGEINWFGRFGENGTIIIDLQIEPGLVLLGGEWTKSDVGHHWSTNGESVDGMEVARLARPSDYAVWAIGDHVHFDATNAFMVFMVPRIAFPPMALNWALLYAITASSDLTITVSPSGAITAYGAGSLTTYTQDARYPNAQAFMDDVISSCSLDSYHYLFPHQESSSILLKLPSPILGHPTRFSIVPLRQSHPNHQARISLDALTAHVPGHNSYFLSSPLNPYIHFFTSGTHRGGPVTFIVDPSGGEFTLSPAFDLAGEKCQVSILTPYDLVRQGTDVLPTPPPSPRFDSIPPPSTSRESSMSSVVSLFNIGEAPPRSRFGSARLAILICVGLRALKFFFTATAVWLVLLYRLIFRWPKLLRLMSHNSNRSNGSTISGPDKGVNPTGTDDSRVKTELSAKVAEGSKGNRKKRPADSTPAELIVETKGGLVKIVVHSVGVTSMLERLVIKVNGKTEIASYTKIQVGIYLFELDTGNGGLMKLTYT